ncbi:hypothetical protein LLS1_35350 [Leifsonia sp. LS1]|nr:hypothetical protein LLS1_35350 [Leifsonia sp. LS1]
MDEVRGDPHIDRMPFAGGDLADEGKAAGAPGNRIGVDELDWPEQALFRHTGVIPSTTTD